MTTELTKEQQQCLKSQRSVSDAIVIVFYAAVLVISLIRLIKSIKAYKKYSKYQTKRVIEIYICIFLLCVLTIEIKTQGIFYKEDEGDVEKDLSTAQRIIIYGNYMLQIVLYQLIILLLTFSWYELYIKITNNLILQYAQKSKKQLYVKYGFITYALLNLIVLLIESLPQHSFDFMYTNWWMVFVFVLTIVPPPILLAYFSTLLTRAIQYANSQYTTKSTQKVQLKEFKGKMFALVFLHLLRLALWIIVILTNKEGFTHWHTLYDGLYQLNGSGCQTLNWYVIGFDTLYYVILLGGSLLLISFTLRIPKRRKLAVTKYESKFTIGSLNDLSTNLNRETTKMMNKNFSNTYEFENLSLVPDTT